MTKRTFRDDRQRDLFAALARCDRLIFACGPAGVSVNLVGRFAVRRERGEDVLHVGDGTDHVHVDWTRVRRVEESAFHGEGLLTFTDRDETLFKLYRPAGAFPGDVRSRLGDLLDGE